MDYLHEYGSSDDDESGRGSPLSPTHESADASRETSVTATSSLGRTPTPMAPAPTHHKREVSCRMPSSHTNVGPGMESESTPPLVPWKSTLDTQLHEAWKLLQSVGNFEDLPGVPVMYACPFCETQPTPLYPTLLRHVARSHGQYHVCLFCGKYGSSRVDQLGRHRKGGDRMTQCAKVKELGGHEAYESLYAYLVENGKDVEDKQFGSLTMNFFKALKAKATAQATEGVDKAA
ncbi:hypothetical protein AURDEDRAFT_121150 [Auricularia subglabra TFB-10046 SS5]|nr:hypothetical protein AURDEDRAFT_121150 [Auricularia subglabra TFB-10046 SS5]